jgi:hypothetical protein
MANLNINATPSEVSPTVGSTQAPPGYPKNAGEAPSINQTVGRGIPQTPDFYSLGIEVLAVCPLGCGRAVSEADLGEHLQDHAVSADQAALGRGTSDFGKNYEA